MSLLNRIIRSPHLPGIVFHGLLLMELILFLVFILRPFRFTPEGHAYTVIEKNYFYPDVILQGKEGSWTMLENHTTLFSPRIYAYLFFIALGKVAGVFSLEPVWVYLVSRVVCGVFAFYTTLWFITRLVPKRFHLVSLLFVLGLEAGPLIQTLPDLKPLWEGRILFIRHFGLPHHLFAQATGMLFIGFLILAVQKVTRIRLVLLVLTGLLSVISMPAYTFTFALTVFPTWFVWSMVYKATKRVIPLLLLASAVILGPNVLFAIEFAKGPPWNNSSITEKTWFTTDYVRMEYLSSFLVYIPLLILFVIAFPFLYRKAEIQFKQLLILLVSWMVGPFFWVAVAATSWFPMPSHRLTDSYGYLPAGILIAVAFHFYVSLVERKSLKILIGIVLLGITILPSIFLTAVYTKDLFEEQKKIQKHNYPSKKVWEGIMFLKTLPQETGILTRETYGELIPAYVYVKTYVGGIYNYPDWRTRQGMANWFFEGTMPEAGIASFLKENNIEYVFYGPDEQTLNITGVLYPTHLTPVFTNSDVTVFRVTGIE